MYDRDAKESSENAKLEEKRVRQLERQRKKDDRTRNKVKYFNHHVTFFLQIKSK